MGALNRDKMAGLRNIPERKLHGDRIKERPRKGGIIDRYQYQTKILISEALSLCEGMPEKTVRVTLFKKIKLHLKCFFQDECQLEKFKDILLSASFYSFFKEVQGE